jgi:hypothetical protein
VLGRGTAGEKGKGEGGGEEGRGGGRGGGKEGGKEGDRAYEDIHSVEQIVLSDEIMDHPHTGRFHEMACLDG